MPWLGEGVGVVHPEFADVYEAHIAAVWRYVRSRIPDHHGAEDVTSDVFARAWRSWARYDPRTGPPTPWLFRIAHRAVADWWRSRGPERPAEIVPEQLAVDDVDDVDPAVLAALCAALAELSERERDILALRFAGDLSLGEIAAVLRVSEGAVKMAASRAVRRLRGALAVPMLAPALTRRLPEGLDDLLAGAADRHSVVDDPALRPVLAHLAVAHRPAVPEGLPKRIAACVGCAQARDRAASARRHVGWWSRFWDRTGLASLTSGGWAMLGPACLVCTLPLTVLPALTAGVVGGVAQWAHNLGLVVAPLLAWIIAWQARRHGRRAPVVLAVAGAAFLGVHAALHFVPLSEVVWFISDWAGALLLLAGALLNWVAMARWAAGQRDQLALRIAS